MMSVSAAAAAVSASGRDHEIADVLSSGSQKFCVGDMYIHHSIRISQVADWRGAHYPDYLDLFPPG